MARLFFLMTVVVVMLVMIVGCGCSHKRPPAKTASELGITGMNQFELAETVLSEGTMVADLAVADRRLARKMAKDLTEKAAFMEREAFWFWDTYGTVWDEARALKRPWWKRGSRSKWTEEWAGYKEKLEEIQKKLHPPGQNRTIAEIDAEFHKWMPDMFRIVTDYPAVYLRAQEAERQLKRAEAIESETGDHFVTLIAWGLVRRAKLNIELSWQVRLGPTFQIHGDEEKEKKEKEELRYWGEMALQYWGKIHERRLAPDETSKHK